MQCELLYFSLDEFLLSEQRTLRWKHANESPVIEIGLPCGGEKRQSI
jgi:hypothetical protein